jgi:hypothetical protein
MPRSKEIGPFSPSDSVPRCGRRHGIHAPLWCRVRGRGSPAQCIGRCITNRPSSRSQAAGNQSECVVPSSTSPVIGFRKNVRFRSSDRPPTAEQHPLREGGCGGFPTGLLRWAMCGSITLLSMYRIGLEPSRTAIPEAIASNRSAAHNRNWIIRATGRLVRSIRLCPSRDA